MYDPQYFTPCCTPGGNPTSQQLAIVYLVCAIGALFDPETVMQGNELARLCFQIGRASLALDMKPSLAVIQAIHLMGMYTLSTGQSDAACVASAHSALMRSCVDVFSGLTVVKLSDRFSTSP